MDESNMREQNNTKFQMRFYPEWCLYFSFRCCILWMWMLIPKYPLKKSL